MRKLSAVLVVLALLGMCSASFGYHLIYNISASVKEVNENGIRGQIPLKANLVVRINDNNDEYEDANLVMYGKGQNKQKVYVQLNDQDSDNYLGVDIWSNGGSDYIFFDIWGNSPFDFEALLVGKAADKDIGFGKNDKRPVVSSLTGVLMVWDGMLFYNGQDVSGMSNISATLNIAGTKGVNGTDPTWTQEQIIEGQTINGKLRGVKPDLEAKHYTELTVVP